MRPFLDIMIDLKDGKKPDYEEVRLACLMANDLLFFAERDVENLTKSKGNEMVQKIIAGNRDIRFKARKKSPEEYLGDHHPDHPTQKQRMAQSEKIWSGFQKYQAQQKLKEESHHENT